MEKLKFPGDCQLELESCGCNDSDTESSDLLSIPKYHKNKRFSVIVEEELLRYVLMNDQIFLFTFLSRKKWLSIIAHSQWSEAPQL